MRVISDTKVPVKIWATDLEAEAEQQLRNLSTMPFIFKHVAAMPDAHAGRGSTVGTVIATQGAIIPAAVGVDIGCGVASLKLPFKIDVFKDLPKLRHSIERSVPTGMNSNKEVNVRMANAWLELGQFSSLADEKLNNRTVQNAIRAIGTLGGGNHFLELCYDQNNDAWILLHSGSRNIGKCLAELHIDKAKGLMKQYFISLPDPDLAYLVQGTHEFDSYLKDLLWAQRFAMANREELMDRVLREGLYHVGMLNVYKDGKDSFLRINTHHNFTAIEHHFGKNIYITRKGAVSAKEGEYGIIPGSMASKTYIVKGLGNPESFCSCSHGSGRKMSRTKARAIFTLEDLKQQTDGVECRKDTTIIDEIPGAYKPIEEVMENQKDLVTVEYTLKQILCVKGD